MAREDPQMKLRLPVDLKNRIEEASKNSGRTLNAEIVSRLQSTFKPEQVKLDFGPANAEVDDESRPVNKRELIQLLNEFVASNNGEVTFKTKVVPDEVTPVAKKPTVNKVILVGNLGRDPEVRYLPSGAPATIQSAPPPNKTTKRPPKVIDSSSSKKTR